MFDDVTAPEQEIYLSHANARQMMEEARGVVGIVDQMPIVQREMLLARAMGRALAHELGHYLLASKVHTRARSDESDHDRGRAVHARTPARFASSRRSGAPWRRGCAANRWSPAGRSVGEIC